MARWLTVFVEVPIATFNPVKTVFDLLRPEHQPEEKATLLYGISHVFPDQPVVLPHRCCACGLAVPGPGVLQGRQPADPPHRQGGTGHGRVVDTPAKVYLGLGRRQSLAEGRGMLFILPTMGLQAFCMRDMQFSIDIIWIADGKVAGIKPKLSPSFKGNVVSPVPVRLVLEVPGGFAESHGIKAGDPVVQNLPAEPK